MVCYEESKNVFVVNVYRIQGFQPCQLKKGGFRSSIVQASRGVQGHAPREKF